MTIGFPTYGLLCPFCFFSWASLVRLLPLGFLIPFTNSAFSWVITNFIGLPWPNYFILILGVHELAINPLLSLFALLLGLQWPILTFSTLYTAHGYAISLFPGFFKPIYLLKAHLFISWTYDPSFLPLGPDGFATCLPNLCYPCCWAFCLPLGSSEMTINTCFNFSNRDSKDSNLYSLNHWIPKIIILPSLQPKLMFIISFSQIIQL